MDFISQILYLCFGTHQVVLPDCVGLEKKIDVYLDGKKIDVPEMQAIVCLNIDSWGAGVHLWGKTFYNSLLMQSIEMINIIDKIFSSDEWRR